MACGNLTPFVLHACELVIFTSVAAYLKTEKIFVCLFLFSKFWWDLAYFSILIISMFPFIYLFLLLVIS